MDEKIDEMRVFLTVADDGGQVETTESLDDAATSAVILSTDEERVAWTGAVLEHLGCEIYPLKAYFNQEPGHEEVQLVVLDPNCLTRQQLDKMLPFLDAVPATCAVLRDGSESPLAEELGQRYTNLPYVFSRADILAAVNGLVTA
jgi:hypothetical protein